MVTGLSGDGIEPADLANTINHRWTTSLLASLTGRSCMSVSGRTATSPKTGSKSNTDAPPSWKSTSQPARVGSLPPGFATHKDFSGSPYPGSSGPLSMSATRSALIWFRIT